jgi:hypothetical protein
MDSAWPKAERVARDIEGTNAVSLFGSPAALMPTRRGNDRSQPLDERFRTFHDELVELIRAEFRVDSLSRESDGRDEDS